MSIIKTGLVLEGGAMRGMFTAGVLDVFMENNITFDGAIGVSAGAVFGCNLKSHQIGRSIRYNKKYCSDRRYVSYRNWMKTGDLYDPEFDYNELPLKLDIFDRETYEKDPMDFYVVSTDVLTGKPVYTLCNKGDAADIQWMRASASMPVFSNPVKIGDGLYLDGGTSDSVPLRYFETLGYDKIVLILTQPKGYRKKPYPFMGFIRKYLKNYPVVADTMASRHIMYNETMDYIDKCENEGKILVIRPEEKLHIKPAEKNPNELQRVYELGRVKGEALVSDVKRFINM